MGQTVKIPDNNSESAQKVRGLKSKYIREIYGKNKAYYDKEWAKLKNVGRGSGNKEVKATVAALAACQDDELANEINKNGVFTKAFIKAIQNDPDIRLDAVVENVTREIRAQYIYDQTPRFETYGNNAETLSSIEISSLLDFSEQDSKPLSIAPKEEYEIISTGYLLTESDSIALVDSETGASRGVNNNIASAWDAAYSTYFKSDRTEVIEPDTVAVNHINNELEQKRGNDNPDEYLDTYPNPPEDGSTERFAWHKGDDYSQLDSAFRNACPEANANNPARQINIPFNSAYRYRNYKFTSFPPYKL